MRILAAVLVTVLGVPWNCFALQYTVTKRFPDGAVQAVQLVADQPQIPIVLEKSIRPQAPYDYAYSLSLPAVVPFGVAVRDSPNSYTRFVAIADVNLGMKNRNYINRENFVLFESCKEKFERLTLETYDNGVGVAISDFKCFVARPAPRPN